MAGLRSDQLLLLAFAILTVGAVGVGALGRSWRASGWAAVAITAVATVVLWTVAARVFISGGVVSPVYFTLGPLHASLVFHIDRLSAVFLLVLSFVGLAANLYAVEYMRRVYPQSSPGRYYPFTMLLTAAMVGVVTASDMFFFFIFWELMSLTSWALVWFDRENETKVRAAWVYFVVIHVASACMLIAAVTVYSRSGSFMFADLAGTMAGIAKSSPALPHVLIALLLIAFTTKAGMFPLGGWLPEAHPAAPAPASAVFSGAMIKTGVYAVIRIVFPLLREPQMAAVWGGIIAVLGALSIFVGTVTALRQDDVKRVLSFHSIGQIGYMLLGVGTAIYFMPTNPALAGIALIAGLYHVVNHACFKSLLFLNAGSAEYYTGTRDLNLMGGLGKLMPVTLITIIVASLSISGIPPFNGFVSKWLIYNATLQGGLVTPVFLILFLAAIFSSIVTLASFMKVVGTMFLGHLATNEKSVPGEVPASMTVAQIGFTAACILLGVAPILPLALLYGAARDALGLSFSPFFGDLFGHNHLGIILGIGGKKFVAAYNPMYILIATAACATFAYVIMRSARAPVRKTAPWYGGEENAPETVRFRAHGLFLPFKEGFANVYPSIKLPRIQPLRSIRVVFDLDKWLYNPLVYAGGRLIESIRRTHSGLPQVYMLWQIVGVILALGIILAVLR